MSESNESNLLYPPDPVLVRCGRVEFRGEYRKLGPGVAVVSLVFDEWYPSLGEAVTLLDGPSQRRATVYSVWVSPREQRVELHLNLTE
ncbi:hypothetical protein DAETH_46440 (plasmid) [Deinococcus aetherius]|uniref:Uncharacterized protein n=1 Tax=Deinococcus aetherius TaxID=200252 RepID=A0ABM8ALH7_9DEIO|nr:hypothetical protein [Deinococcus aetherius]BDP44675.1 hypothetical protein DAETH_46440 [Deinococcus aetherius]